jgi:hypothetical protein
VQTYREWVTGDYKIVVRIVVRSTHRSEANRDLEGPKQSQTKMPDIQRLDEAGRRGGRITLGPPMTLD